MLNSPLLPCALRASGLARSASRAGRALRDHTMTFVYLGTAAAVAAGAGSAGAAAVSGAAASLPAGYHLADSRHVIGRHGRQLSPAADASLISSLPSLTKGGVSTPVSLPQAARAAQAALAIRTSRRAASLPGTPAAGSQGQAAAPAVAAPATPASPAPAASPVSAAQPSLTTWSGIEDAAANQASGDAPLMDNPLPVPVTWPQTQMPMSQGQWENATTITQQALNMGMGLRSAVIAVATSMQESGLININYGTYDSLGLFQQRPSAGWGSAEQVTDPAYASDAFLDALHTYQVSNPGWASQPVWQPAQAVQNSAYPTAYEKWEVQAATVVMGVARNLGR
jgi:hypothetical protein